MHAGLFARRDAEVDEVLVEDPASNGGLDDVGPLAREARQRGGAREEERRRLTSSESMQLTRHAPFCIE